MFIFYVYLAKKGLDYVIAELKILFLSWRSIDGQFLALL